MTKGTRSVMAASIGALQLSTGCYHNQIANPDHWAPATEVERRTVWSFFWGAVQQDIRPTNCLGDGLAEVTVSTNFGFVLISVASLGMAVPVTIEWRCAKQHAPGDQGL